MASTHGIHHVSAISGDAQHTLDFYAGTLGLRLVKRTVNFDDPTGYHLYFGDADGEPGSAMTLFPMPDGRTGRVGTGQAAVTTFAIPPASLGWWMERLSALRVPHELPTRRFRDAAPGDGGETVIAFQDPFGLRLELATDARAASRAGWAGGEAVGIPAEHAVRGIFGVTLWIGEDGDALARLLVERMGMRRAAQEGTLVRYVADDAVLGRVVDVRDAAGFWTGDTAVGTVHHVAFRVADAAEELAVRDAVREAGVSTTPVRDRFYFESVYFRAPGGVLFELATDGPGFAIDEPPHALGATLRLPPRHEARRAEIEGMLPLLRLPHAPPAPAGSAEDSARTLAGLAMDTQPAEQQA